MIDYRTRLLIRFEYNNIFKRFFIEDCKYIIKEILLVGWPNDGYDGA